MLLTTKKFVLKSDALQTHLEQKALRPLELDI